MTTEEEWEERWLGNAVMDFWYTKPIVEALEQYHKACPETAAKCMLALLHKLEKRREE